jgi:hypothetical protein
MYSYKNVIGKVLLVSTLFLLPNSTLQALTPAFPGAEGGGMYTSGGRGGVVYYVNTILDNSIGNSVTHEGSLRWCLSQTGKRTILFKVSGVITLTSQLTISKGDVTIAGQTAPGDGICLRDYTTYVGSKNVIIRYMHFRLGDVALQENDAIWGREQSDIMLDHCSMSWCVDECASFYSNKNFTMQWCMLGESLRVSIHDKGTHGYGGIWGGENATYHHNMLIHHDSRNPRFNGWKRSGLNYSSTLSEERMDYRNNVVYNWGANSTYGGESGHYNMVNNYYKYGPATSPKNRLVQADIDAGTTIILPRYGKYYLSGNYVFGYPTITADNKQGLYNKTGFVLDSVLVSTPFACYPVTTHSAEKAFEKVLAFAGCSLKRDTIDARYAKEALTGTYTFTGSKGLTKGLIDTQVDVGGWPAYNSTTAPVDTDIDGMPDVWETANGLNPNNAADGNAFTLSSGGYTNLEVYLNSLVGAITNQQNMDALSDIKEETTVSHHALQVIYGSSNLSVRASKPMQQVQFYAADGRLVFKKKLTGETEWSGSTEHLGNGLYFVKAELADHTYQSNKFIVLD